LAVSSLYSFLSSFSPLKQAHGSTNPSYQHNLHKKAWGHDLGLNMSDPEAVEEFWLSACHRGIHPFHSQWMVDASELHIRLWLIELEQWSRWIQNSSTASGSLMLRPRSWPQAFLWRLPQMIHDAFIPLWLVCIPFFPPFLL
jgi:hypothetical protein